MPSPNRDRSAGHLINILLTVLTLFVAVKVSDGGFANSIDKITKNLDVALTDLRNDMPVYENYTDKEVYLSSTYFHPRGMAGLYNLTNKFMELVVDSDFLMKGLIVVDSSGYPQFNREISILEVLKYYWLLLTVVLTTVLITLFLPVCGFCFCCCRCCCGRCGARSRPADKRRDLCKKVIQGTLLIALGTAMLFCVVCAFATNQQLEEGIGQVGDNLRASKRDSYTYLESTKKQTVLMLDTNYKRFSVVFTNTITKSGEHVTQQLSIWSNATAMTDLNKFVTNIPNIRSSLEALKNDTKSLRSTAIELDAAIRKIRYDLQQTLTDCHLSECNNIKEKISHLQATIDYNKLPLDDVSSTLETLNGLDTERLETAAEDGMDQLNSIEIRIKNHLNSTLGEALVQVEKAGVKIRQVLDELTRSITDVQKEMNRTIDPALDDINRYIKVYHHYRYYGGLAISCILLLITICIVLGLICGICGKRPDGYSDNCCNKGAGSQFLICAVMIMFIFGMFIGVITLAMLILGLSADRGVCYPIRQPENSRMMDLIDEFVDIVDSTSLDITLKEALLRCYQNQSIYTTLNLKTKLKKLNIDTIQDNFDISLYLDKMNDQLDSLTLTVTLLSGKNEVILRNLSSFELNVNLEQFQDELQTNFTNFSLNEISTELENLVVVIEDRPEYDSIKADIRLSILNINTYEKQFVQPMKKTAERIIENAQKLDAQLKMNSSSFSEAIDRLISEIKDAQDKLNSQGGTSILKTAASQFGEILKNQIDSYITLVTHVTKYELGQCGPMSLAINSTLTATCDKVVLPWNGFWVTMFLSLLLFIPTIIVSVKLASLYQKYKQYGQYVETRAKRGGKKKKKGKKYEDRPQNMGGEVVTREYATGSHPTDARYSDMAPKHWEEFPNGGPPQYQRAPTEYERPPPYYYPGSGDQ